MTREEVIAAALKTGLTKSNLTGGIVVRHSNGSWVDITEKLELFAAIIAKVATAKNGGQS